MIGADNGHCDPKGSHFVSNWGSLLSHKTPRDPLRNLYGLPSILSSPDQPSFSGLMISQNTTKVVWCICVDHSQLWAITVCKLPSETKVAIMPNNIRPVIIENIILFSGLGLSQREIISFRPQCVESNSILLKPGLVAFIVYQCYPVCWSADRVVPDSLVSDEVETHVHWDAAHLHKVSDSKGSRVNKSIRCKYVS